MTTTDQKLESLKLQYLERQRRHRIALEQQVQILLEAYRGQANLVSLLSAQVAEQQEQIDKMRTWAAGVEKKLKTGS